VRLYRKRPASGFSLIEVLFAIGMLGIGIVGILSLFTTGISAAAWSQNTTSAAMEAQSLYTRILSETNESGERIFLNRIADPSKPPSPTKPSNDWIQSSANERTPVKVDPDRELWWSCRVSKYQMDLEDPLDADKDQKPPKYKELPYGLYQIAIAVYRNTADKWKEKPPIVVYTTYVSAGY
jgi:type II secretory pathway pseudopilin PulG